MDTEYWEKTAERERRKARLPEGAAEGTCLPGGEEDCWFTKGTTDWYWVNVRLRVCACPQFFYRGGPDKPCKHLIRLALFLGKEMNGSPK